MQRNEPEIHRTVISNTVSVRLVWEANVCRAFRKLRRQQGGYNIDYLIDEHCIGLVLQNRVSAHFVQSKKKLICMFSAIVQMLNIVGDWFRLNIDINVLFGEVDICLMIGMPEMKTVKISNLVIICKKHIY